MWRDECNQTQWSKWCIRRIHADHMYDKHGQTEAQRQEKSLLGCCKRQGQSLQERKGRDIGLRARSKAVRPELGNSLNTNKDTSEIIHIADLIARDEELNKRREERYFSEWRMIWSGGVLRRESWWAVGGLGGRHEWFQFCSLFRALWPLACAWSLLLIRFSDLWQYILAFLRTQLLDLFPCQTLCWALRNRGD